MDKRLACCLIGLVSCAQASPTSEASLSTESLTPAPVSKEVQPMDPQLYRRLRAELSRSSADLVIQHEPGGVQRIDLKGRFKHASIAVRDDDGRLQHRCVSSPQELDHWLTPNSTQ